MFYDKKGTLMYLAFLMIAATLSLGAAGMAAQNGLGLIAAVVVYACTGTVIFLCLAVARYLSETREESASAERARRRDSKSTV